MVKNTKGGKNSKKMARKLFTVGPANHLRTADPKEPSEIYACVSKLLGNGMAHVMNTQGVTMLLHIRNKFRGRGKRDNTIKVGSVVLAGARTFETTRPGKFDNCDLLEVYNEMETMRLKEDTYVCFDAFKEIRGFDGNNSDEDDMFMFSNDNTTEVIQEITGELDETDQAKSAFITTDQDINIDDI